MCPDDAEARLGHEFAARVDEQDCRVMIDTARACARPGARICIRRGAWGLRAIPPDLQTPSGGRIRSPPSRSVRSQNQVKARAVYGSPVAAVCASPDRQVVCWRSQSLVPRRSTPPTTALAISHSFERTACTLTSINVPPPCHNPTNGSILPSGVTSIRPVHPGGSLCLILGQSSLMGRQESHHTKLVL